MYHLWTIIEAGVTVQTLALFVLLENAHAGLPRRASGMCGGSSLGYFESCKMTSHFRIRGQKFHFESRMMYGRTYTQDLETNVDFRLRGVPECGNDLLGHSAFLASWYKNYVESLCRPTKMRSVPDD
jgi:hypothetical protein